MAVQPNPTAPSRGRILGIIAAVVLLGLLAWGGIAGCQALLSGAAKATPTPSSTPASAQAKAPTATPSPTINLAEAMATSNALQVLANEQDAKANTEQTKLLNQLLSNQASNVANGGTSVETPEPPATSAPAPTEEPEEEEAEVEETADSEPLTFADTESVRALGGDGVPVSNGTGNTAPDLANDRMELRQDGAYGPEIGHSSPGYGASEDELVVAVGWELTFPTDSGELVLTDGCQQVLVPENVYCRNCGGTDWGFQSWKADTDQTEIENEYAVMSYQAARQQQSWEMCPVRNPEDVLDHVYVVQQDGLNVSLVPWREWRRESGVDHTRMFAPGDRVYGWSIGLGSAYMGTPGQDGQDNLCLGGECYLPEAPVFGWCGGCSINSTWPGEIPDNATPIGQDKINSVLATLPE